MTTLILAALSMATAPVQGEEIKLLRQPTIHDQQVVFNYAGDLWTTELSGGIARRLTSFPANESNATFSPDGKWIAFTAGYEGTADIYVIPSEGGQPKRITYEGNGATPRFWLDNDTIGVVQPREGFTNPLVYLNREGGMPKPTPVLEFITGSISADKKLLAYNRSDSFSFNWRRYRGGTQGVVSLFNFENNTYSEVPHGREQNYHPMIVGRDVYYISDKVAGTQNLYKYNLDRKSTEQLTKFTDTEIRWPKTDGKTIVFERGATLFAFDIASKSIKELNPRVLGDLNLIRPQLKRVNANLFGMSLSPSGQRLAVEARGDIFTIPAKSGDTRNLTDSQGVRDGSPSWSPDGQTIAYISDKSGELEVYTMNQRGGAEKKLTKGQLKPVSVTFSPDSKTLMVVDVDTSFYLLDVATGKTTLVVKPKFGISSPDFSPSGDLIAFIDAQENLFGATFIYEIKTGKMHQITDGYYNDSAVTFDKNGKFLYIASQREYQPILSTFEQTLDTPPLQRVFMYPLKKDTVNPLTPKIDDEPLPPTPAPAAPPKPEEKKAEAKTDIDFDGLAKRAIVLPWASGQVSGLIGDTDGVFAVYNGALVQFDLNGKKSETILEPGWSNLDINPQRNKIGGLEAIVDPRAEWKQILNEGWRNYRDKFYDPKMVGVDWEAVRVQYNKLLPYCTSRADLNYLLGMMIGELGTGHAYVGGGDMGISIAPVTVGRLGATYEEVGGKIRIKQIFSGDSAETGSRGPLSEPGLGVDQG
ncbi:MAG: hypothetical protein K8R88_10080, partial [Armatimonadetes bacterium]|nr:hypothetical protein [Armatimonadota bacterium]